MTDITLHGTGQELSKHLAEFEGQQLTITIHMETAKDQDFNGPESTRVRDAAHLEQLLLEGLNSGPAVPVTEETWKHLRQLVADRAAGKDA